MKIGDIKVGEVYGALDSPASGRRYGSGGTPRPVKVLEIVVEESRKYSRYSSASTIVKTKRVLVQATDDPYDRGSYARGIDKVAKDATFKIEARQLVGPWSDMKTEILQKIQDVKDAEAAQEAAEARIEALGFGPREFTYTKSGRGWELEVKFHTADAVERVLVLLEQAVAANQAVKALA